MNLADKYRPRWPNWSGIIGQEAITDRLAAIEKAQGLGGRAFIVSGQTGRGKTTIARMIADSVADPCFQWEIDAQDMTLDFVRELESQFLYRAMGSKPGKCWIVNEAHGLRGPVVSRLLTTLEGGKHFDALPDYISIVFTTTKDGKEKLFDDYADSLPFASRCLQLELGERDLQRKVAEWAMAIAQAEGLDGRPLKDYMRLVKDCKTNPRLVLMKIDAGEMLPT